MTKKKEEIQISNTGGKKIQSLDTCIYDWSYAMLFQTGMYNRKKTNEQVTLYIEFSWLVIEKSERNDIVNQMTVYALLYQVKFSRRNSAQGNPFLKLHIFTLSLFSEKNKTVHKN